jgi:hypothetical protein
MKARQLLAVLARPPLRYRVVRELAHSGAEFYLERPVEVEDHLPASHPEGPRARP